MSDEKDASQKTEEATPHKLEEGRKKGQIPLSKEVNHFFAFLVCCILVGIWSPSISRNLSNALRPYFEAAHTIVPEGHSYIEFISGTLWRVTLIMILPLSLFIVAGVISALSQTQFLISADPLKPKFERISLMKGIKRLFSLKSMAEFFKGLLKMSIVGGIIFWVIWPEVSRLDVIVTLPVSEILNELKTVILDLFIAGAVSLAVIAGFDYFFQRFQFLKEMKMSKQEVKEEHKQMEGDPHLKAKIKRMQREISQSRTLEKVPEATVLIMNPTHYAVALKWEEKMPAPKVIAKGVDTLALKMRDVAQEKHVTVVQNPPLARMLYASVKVDQFIKPDQYKAVAQVIRYVMDLEAKKKEQRL
ncbi:Flagellar biosynthetic protein FlhB [Candidatus Bealeia paramacronuclearis]|uniref:Flagellar biosynthetic protein FlhB n=1 Tax=Candidatus Bealeia paramacronuclearis TaxID=1921001 RepID=A0ABZ2BZW6_9PROT|nr:Flagellar biosynthetic protein FlhB [Candidatus Bealeia paramacronuclearis]